MAVLKVVGWSFSFLFLFCFALLIFLFLREWYIKLRAEKELRDCLTRCIDLQESISRVRKDIDEKVLRHCEMSPEDEWRGYCAQLRGGAYTSRQDSKAMEDQCGILGMLWFLHNARVRQWELCPELCKKENDLRVRLEHENKMIYWLKRIYRPYFMRCVNYSSWRRYCQERSNVT